MIPSPHIPSNPQTTTPVINPTLIYLQPMFPPLFTPTPQNIAAEHTTIKGYPWYQYPFSTKTVTDIKPTKIPLKRLASHNKPGLQEPCLFLPTAITKL